MILRRQLDQNIGDCLNRLGRFWMFTPTVHAADDLELVMDELWEDTPLDQLAAGLVFAIARHNNLITKGLAIGIKLGDVAEYFDLTVEEVLIIADDIEEKLNLNAHPERYSEFDFPQLDTEFEDIPSDITDRSDVLAVFRYKSTIDRDTLNELDDFVREELFYFNEDVSEEDYLHLISVRAEGNLLELVLDGYLEDVEVFSFELEEHDLDLEEIRYIDEAVINRYAPSSSYAAFMEQYEAMGLDHLKFENLEDLEALMQSFIGKSPDEIGEQSNIPSQGKAMIEAIRAFDLPRDESIAQAQNVIVKFPECLEAHICLAGWEQERSKRFEMLKEILRLGEKELNITEINLQGVWWLDHRTRPYMRAMRLLAEESLAGELNQEATELFWQMLAMDEIDHQGNRMILLEILILAKDWHSVEKLFGMYPKEDSLLFVYGKVVYFYHVVGKKKKTKKALLKAHKRNQYPLRLVAGLEEYPEDEAYFTPGDKLEATTVIDFLLACFGDDPELAEFFVQELHDLGAWDVQNPKFDLSENDFVPSAKIIPLDRRSDN